MYKYIHNDCGLIRILGFPTINCTWHLSIQHTTVYPVHGTGYEVHVWPSYT